MTMKRRKAADEEEAGPYIPRRICIGWITSTDYIERVLPFWQPELLTTDLARIVCGWCSDYYQKYDKAPLSDIEAIYHEQKAKLDPDTADQIGEIMLESLSGEYERDPIKVDYLLDQTKTYFRSQCLLQSMDEINTRLERGELAEAENEARRLAGLAISRGDAEPEPLRKAVPAAAEYPFDALGNILGPIARRMHEVVQAPDAICGQSILAAASLAAQPHADVMVHGRLIPLSLWCLSVAQSGDRKSEADRIALEPHREYQRSDADRHAHLERQYAYDKAQLDRRSRQMQRLYADGKTKEAKKLMQQLMADSTWLTEDQKKKAIASNLPIPPTKPSLPWTLVSDPTLEGLHKLLATSPSLGLFTDEAAQFLGGYSMGAENKMRTAGALSKLWGSGEFDRVRSIDGAMRCSGRRLAAHLLMQPIVAATILGDEILCEQGFLSRWLIAWPRSYIGERVYNPTDIYADRTMRRYSSRIRDLLTREPPVSSDDACTLQPRPLLLAPEAQQKYEQIHNTLERRMRSGNSLNAVTQWGSKAAEQVLRIAGVLTLVENPDAKEIVIDTINRAYTLVKFSLSEAVRVVGYNRVPESVRNAEALLEWCRTGNITMLYSSRAMQFGPTATRDKDSLDAAIRRLVGVGRAVPIEGGAKIDGRHRTKVWKINFEPIPDQASPLLIANPANLDTKRVRTKKTKKSAPKAAKTKKKATKMRDKMRAHLAREKQKRDGRKAPRRGVYRDY